MWKNVSSQSCVRCMLYHNSYNIYKNNHFSVTYSHLCSAFVMHLIEFSFSCISIASPSSSQARTEYLRRKSRAALQAAGERRDDDDEDDGRSGGSAALEHLNLFPLEESSEKKGNEEYLREKKEEKVIMSLLSSHLSDLVYFNASDYDLILLLYTTDI